MMPQVLLIINLLILLLCADGLLNPSSFRNWDRMIPRLPHTRPCCLQNMALDAFLQTDVMGENCGGSDEDLFIAMNKRKQERQDRMKAFIGAGVPRSTLEPEEIVPLLMKALENNNLPEIDAGLTSVWEFSSDTTKYIFKNNITGKIPELQ